MTPQHFLFTVAAEDSGTRLDKYLAAHLPGLSRSQLQRLIQEGQVGLAQGVVTASYRVRGGDVITLDVPPPRPARPVAEALALQMEDAGTDVIIREEVVTDATTHSRQATELALGVLARAASALLGNRWKPHRVMFSHEAPPDLHLHRRIFKSKLVFGSEYNAFVCAAQDLDSPSSAANPALARYAEQLLQSLPKAQDRSPSMEVREAIYVLLPMGRATVEQVAKKLGLNVRTLQRQLEEDGVTFSELINSVRRELAVRYVRSGQHSLGQVAELLGYSTQTSFTRWFKSEFGVAPRQWQPDGTPQPPHA